MESFTNEQQAILEKAIRKFLTENREWIIRRIFGLEGIEIRASPDKDINLNTSGSGKAYYNSVEINTGGGGGGTGDRIAGAGCPLSAEQPSVICSPPGRAVRCQDHCWKGRQAQDREERVNQNAFSSRPRFLNAYATIKICCYGG